MSVKVKGKLPNLPPSVEKTPWLDNQPAKHSQNGLALNV